MSVELDLRRRLVGRRVVAEIGLDATTHERVEAALQRLLLRTRVLSRIANSHPALLATYLVGHGVYRYEAGNFYGMATLRGIDQSAGPAFRAAIDRLGLETFEDLVAGDNALRYVGPILAHGGIPKYCLDDFFSLLLRDMERVSGDAAELLSFWRTRRSAFFGIDAPVRRFLLFGGELARDVLDRCIDMVREHARDGSFPRPVDIGLPPYIVAAFRNRDERRPKRSSRGQRTIARPVVTLDPWGGIGPQLLLPATTLGTSASWRIVADGVLERVRASAHEIHQVRLNPARAWTVELYDGASILSEVPIEGLDAIPALFFDPADGGLIGPGGGLRVDDVWVLAPGGAVLAGVNSLGEVRPVSFVQQLPDPTGAWSGYTLVHLSLLGIRALSVRKSATEPERRITIRSPAERATLVGRPIQNVSTGEGMVVYGALPELALPQDSALEKSAWRVRLALGGVWENLDVGALPQGEHGLRIDNHVPIDRASSLGLVVQGPLGADLRVAFLHVPGLEVTCPQRVVLSGDRHGFVSVLSPHVALDVAAVGERVSIRVPDQDDTAQFIVEPDSAAPLKLFARIPRVMWGIQHADFSEVVVANRVLTLAVDEMRDTPALTLMVRTGIDDLPLSLALLLGPRILQTSDHVRSSRGGRWVFDLARFTDTALADDAPMLEFRLTVAGREVIVARVRRSLHVGNVQTHVRVDGEFTTVEVEFDEDRPVRDRVIRLWSWDRPWEPPVVEPIPDGRQGRASVTRYDELPVGAYLMELAVHDGWTSVTRPKPSAPGVIRFQIGTPREIRERLDRLSLIPPLNVAEIAAVTGFVSRDLTDQELAIVVPALLDTTSEMLDLPGATELTSGRFVGVRGLLLANSVCFARAVVGAVESGRLAPLRLTPLAVALGHKIRPIDDSGAESLESVLGALWEVAPCLAAGLDVAPNPAESRAARFRQFLGWDPAEGLDGIARGRPVEQLFVGMAADTLEVIARSISLVPDQVLSLDSLVEANVEWLLAQKRGRDVTGWWQQWLHLLPSAADLGGCATNLHLTARKAPAGTVAWAGVPALTLACALHLLDRTAKRFEATRALLDALEFAPLLVERDLVLARVLLAMDPDLAHLGLEPHP